MHLAGYKTVKPGEIFQSIAKRPRSELAEVLKIQNGIQAERSGGPQPDQQVENNAKGERLPILQNRIASSSKRRVRLARKHPIIRGLDFELLEKQRSLLWKKPGVRADFNSPAPVPGLIRLVR